MNNYFKIPGMEFSLSYDLPNSFYEELYPLLEKGYGGRVEAFCYGSKSKYYSAPEMPRGEFGYPSEDSDVDIAVPDNPLFENVLMFEGWTKGDKERLYAEGDGITISVWNKIISGHNVQISVRHADIYPYMKYVWDMMSPQFYWKYINKRSPHYMGKEGVSEYLNNQISLVHNAPIMEVRALDSNFVYNPRVAAEERMAYWTDVMGFVPRQPKEYLNTVPVRRALSKTFANLEPAAIDWGNVWGEAPARQQNIEVDQGQDEPQEAWPEPVAEQAQRNFARYENFLVQVRAQNRAAVVADENVAF